MGILRNLTFDWADSFSEWYIAYPGKDPLECTVAVFEALIMRTQKNKKWVDGKWEGPEDNANKVDILNRDILIRARFPSYFPDLFADLEDEDG